MPEEQNFVPPSYLQSQKTHLGLASCRLIKDYVTTYPHLREVAVLLKTFLAQQDLNSAYLGKRHTLFNSFYRWHKFVQRSATDSGIYELLQTAAQPKYHAFETTDGIPGLLLKLL